MRLRLLALLAVVLAGQAGAVTYYYQLLSQEPSSLSFTAAKEALLCAVLAGRARPVPREGASVVGLSSLGVSCPQGPQVVWGRSDLGQQAFALRLTVRFWGPLGKAHGRDRNAEDLLKSRYLAEFVLQGSGAVPGSVQVAADLVVPGFSPADAGDVDWRSLDTGSLLRTRFSNAQITNRKKLRDFQCPLRYDHGCWQADFSWDLPVRLLLSGGEWPGQDSLDLIFDAIVPRPASAQSLSIRNGRLEEERLLPVGGRRPEQ